MRWKGTEKDIPYGQGILEAIRPFAESLISEGSSVRAIKKDLDNLWLLGGEIIRHVSMHHEYDKIPPAQILRKSVDMTGGPLCRHLDSESGIRSFDSTCRKLHCFLEGKNQSPA
jgi:hypothetical protein